MSLCDCKYKDQCQFSLVRNAGGKTFELCKTSEKHRKTFSSMSRTNRVEKKYRGVGDAVKKAVDIIGRGKIKQCSGCKKRQAWLNHVFPSEYEPPKPIPYGGTVTRNLIYHIWPNGELWKWHVGELKKRWGLFNGRKVIGIAESSPGDADQVKRELPDDCEFIVSPNNKKLGEMVHFRELLQSVESLESNEITMYAHAKGAKYANVERKHGGLMLWSQAMYDILLDYPEVIEQGLLSKGVCGVFSMTSGQKGWPKHLEHHFSGTFYWFRNAHVYNRNWMYTQESYYGSEMWPGLMFKTEDVEALVPLKPGRIFHMYKPQFWEKTLTPIVERWKADHEAFYVPVDEEVQPDHRDRPAAVGHNDLQ